MARDDCDGALIQLFDGDCRVLLRGRRVSNVFSVAIDSLQILDVIRNTYVLVQSHRANFNYRNIEKRTHIPIT